MASARASVKCSSENFEVQHLKFRFWTVFGRLEAALRPFFTKTSVRELLLKQYHVKGWSLDETLRAHLSLQQILTRKFQKINSFNEIASLIDLLMFGVFGSNLNFKMPSHLLSQNLIARRGTCPFLKNRNAAFFEYKCFRNLSKFLKLYFNFFRREV